MQSNTDDTLKSRGGFHRKLEKINAQIFISIVQLGAGIVIFSWFMPYGKSRHPGRDYQTLLARLGGANLDIHSINHLQTLAWFIW